MSEKNLEEGMTLQQKRKAWIANSGIVIALMALLYFGNQKSDMDALETASPDVSIETMKHDAKIYRESQEEKTGYVTDADVEYEENEDHFLHTTAVIGEHITTEEGAKVTFRPEPKAIILDEISFNSNGSCATGGSGPTHCNSYVHSYTTLENGKFEQLTEYPNTRVKVASILADTNNCQYLPIDDKWACYAKDGSIYKHVTDELVQHERDGILYTEKGQSIATLYLKKYE